MVNEIGFKVKSFEIINGDLKLQSENGDTIYIVGDNDWANLIHNGEKYYYDKHSIANLVKVATITAICTFLLLEY